MKRVISALLSVLLLSVLAACSRNVGQSENSDIGTLKTAIGEAHTDFDGVNVKILNLAEDEGKTRLNVSWVNETSYEVVYGEYYDIEREQSGKWSSCAINGALNFTDIGYELGRKATQAKTYDLSNSFDIAEKGKYRFVTDCIVYDKGRGGESTKCKLWAEFTVSGTNGEAGTDSNSADTGKDVNGSLIEFEAQYIRTDGYREDGKYPVVKIIRSVEELNNYYNENKGKYNLERRTDPSTDSTIGFLDACDKYNADYFDSRILVMVLLEESSGSTRHNVDSVKYGSDGKLYINIRKSSTEAGTCDMAEWHVLIEPESNITIAAESDVVVYLDGADLKSQPTVVRESGAYSNIELSIPTGWEYETERMEDSGYCIAFWPEGFDGKIKMCYYPFFGVCGTGLECEAVTVGNYDGVKGSYGSKNSWYFISFNNVPGSYAAINEGADKWWDRYGDEAMQILGTVRIADGIIDEARAIEIAVENVNVKYDLVKAVFDTEKGVWNVRFYEKNMPEAVLNITVSYNGKLNNEVSK